MTRKFLILAPFLTLLLTTSVIGQEEDFSILDNWLVHADSRNALYRTLQAEASQLLERRAEERRRIQTAAEWREEIARLKGVLSRLLPPFPEKSPLNPQVLGVIRKDGYRFEKIVFESHPDFYVTAGLFLPDPIEEPAPAIVYCSGHTAEGFRSEVYQTVILDLVRRGFVVLAFDPLGQGERLQYLDPSGVRSMVGGPTREHSYAGAQSLLTGDSFARYMVWDGIRAIDYLASRPEVDPGRIGVTGRSGGGTQTAYIAAIDERVRLAAPECYISGFHRLLESIGPQDAEQNLLGGLREGADHLELLLSRAPLPTLIIATTRDFFSIQGARETFAEARRSFSSLGHPETLAMVEDDAPHASTPRNRNALYAFSIQHLRPSGAPDGPRLERLSAAELQFTETGQVLSSLGGRTVFDLIKQRAEALELELQRTRSDPLHSQRVLEEARRLSGYSRPAQSLEPVFAGRYQRDGYSIERHFIPAGSYAVPLLLFVPERPSGTRPVLYLDPEGKEAAARSGGPVETLVLGGSTVLVPDLIGIGELGNGDFRGDAYDFGPGVGRYNTWFFGSLIGRSTVGLQAADITRCTDFLVSHGGRNQTVQATAIGNLGPALLHAAAFDPALSEITVDGSLASFGLLARTEYYQPELVHSTVPAALTAYDLPDLAAALSPRNLTIRRPIGADGLPLPAAQVLEVFEVTRQTYEREEAARSLRIE